MCDLARPRKRGDADALLRSTVIVLVLVLLSVPAAAHAEQQRATAGAVEAVLTYAFDREQHRFTGLDLTIARAGVVTHRGLPPAASCPEGVCGPVRDEPGRRALTVRDLDADAEPEVLVDLYTGGAHCCFVTTILRWDGTAYRAQSRSFGDPWYRLADLDRDGTVEFVTADARFAYRWSAFAFTVFPVQILAFDHGTFDDVTVRFRSRVRRDAARAWRAFRDMQRERYETRGAIAAWAADRYRLGERAAALRTLRRLARTGALRGRAPDSPRAFVRQLDRELRRWGYGTTRFGPMNRGQPPALQARRKLKAQTARAET